MFFVPFVVHHLLVILTEGRNLELVVKDLSHAFEMTNLHQCVNRAYSIGSLRGSSAASRTSTQERLPKM